jgi:hypothetical protein
MSAKKIFWIWIALFFIFENLFCYSKFPNEKHKNMGSLAYAMSNEIQIQADCSKIIGNIRNLNDYGTIGPWATLVIGKRLRSTYQRETPTSGQLQHLNDLSSAIRGFKEMGIRYTRIFDNPVPSRKRDKSKDFRGVMGSIFPDADADSQKESSYNFRQIDEIIKPAIEAGARVWLTLLYDIGRYSPTANYEGGPKPKRPKNYNKWCEVAKHLVMHLNEGWANGHYWNVKDFLLYNEPGPLGLWYADTPESYAELYLKLYKVLKAYDPQIKLYAPVVAGLGIPFWVKRKFTPFHEGFLDYLVKKGGNLDFFDFHIYGIQMPHEIVERVAEARKALDRYGNYFKKTKLTCSEWGGPHKHGRFPFGVMDPAAFLVSATIFMQETELEIANKFKAVNMFDSKGNLHSIGNGYKMLNEMQATPNRIYTSGSDYHGFAVMGGISESKKEIQVLISNCRSMKNRYTLNITNFSSGKYNYRILLLDEEIGSISEIGSGTFEGSAFSSSRAIKDLGIHLIKIWAR